jgi:hypothetical protein
MQHYIRISLVTLLHSVTPKLRLTSDDWVGNEILPPTQHWQQLHGGRRAPSGMAEEHRPPRQHVGSRLWASAATAAADDEGEGPPPSSGVVAARRWEGGPSRSARRETRSPRRPTFTIREPTAHKPMYNLDTARYFGPEATNRPHLPQNHTSPVAA